MRLELNNIKYSLKETGHKEEVYLRQLSAKKLKIKGNDIKELKINKKSVDARKKDDVFLVYSLLIDIEDSKSIARLTANKDVALYKQEEQQALECGSRVIHNRPIIIGSGPAGLFAGLILAERGYKPLILERGMDVEGREKYINQLFNNGSFDAETNIQFGEGGAGTFSDGKLTTRIKDKRCDIVLNRFVEAGAPKEIEYINKPHIGTDILKAVVKNIRQKIISLGGDVRFLAKVTDIIVENDTAKAVVINDKEIIESNVIIAALGHSARDTYKMLFDKGISMIQKPFSIGVRIEHLQQMINQAQYGKFAGHPLLGAADYVLTTRVEATGRSAYSFCMCPGGMVVAAASEADMVVTNGMSEYRRDRANANSAMVVSVSPEDFESKHPLAGIEFQRLWERKAYEAGGGGYYAPVQLAGDFLRSEPSTKYGSIKPSYMPGTKLTDMRQCLPSYVTDTLAVALRDFDKKIKGFADNDAIMTGVETRTSAPVRIVRKETMESENISNFYPIGEGAGYAGGIVSAAVDGIKMAEKIIEGFKPVN